MTVPCYCPLVSAGVGRQRAAGWLSKPQKYEAADAGFEPRHSSLWACAVNPSALPPGSEAGGFKFII